MVKNFALHFRKFDCASKLKKSLRTNTEIYLNIKISMLVNASFLTLCYVCQWELEKWKFQKGTHIVFVSQATEKALRVRSDAAIDGLGDPSLPTSKSNRSKRTCQRIIKMFCNTFEFE